MKSNRASHYYLILYNLAQFAGWLAIAVIIVLHFSNHKFSDGLYDKVHFLLNIFQTLALLEVVHAALGFVKSNVVLTGFQVMSRVFLVWGVAYLVKEVRNSTGITMTLCAWSLVETVRYLFYACNLVDYVPYWLSWCRYSLFIVLYPLGVTGELLTTYTALKYVKSSQIFSVALPNPVNMSFSYYYALIVIMLTYVPVFPQLYMHMFAQRKKVLGKKKET